MNIDLIEELAENLKGIDTLTEWQRAKIAIAADLIIKLASENEALRAQIGQGEPTDEQIMATVQQKGFGFSQSRPLAQQWDQVCELIRVVVRERNTHPAPQQKLVVPGGGDGPAPLWIPSQPAPQQIGQGVPEEGDLLTIAYLHGFAKGKEAAHNIGEKK